MKSVDTDFELMARLQAKNGTTTFFYNNDSISCGSCACTHRTAATLGALLGIINVAKGFPEKWILSLGNVINTLYAINKLF